MQLVGSEAEHLLKCRIGPGHPPVPFHTGDADGGGIKDRLKLFFAFPQGVFGAAAGGDVLHRAFIMQQHAARAANRPRVLRNPYQGAIAPAHLRFKVRDSLAQLQEALELCPPPGISVQVRGVNMLRDKLFRSIIAVDLRQRRIHPQEVPFGRRLKDSNRRPLEHSPVGFFRPPQFFLFGMEPALHEQHAAPEGVRAERDTGKHQINGNAGAVARAGIQAQKLSGCFPPVRLRKQAAREEWQERPDIFADNVPGPAVEQPLGFGVKR